MWFKNVTLFQFNNPFRVSIDSLEEKLSKRTARNCGPLETSTLGWSSPLPNGETLTLPIDGSILIAATRSEKILPASVIREALNERITEIEATEEREVRNKERQRLREEITVEMLPRAFSRSRTTHVMIDPENGWLLVDTASRARAEELTVLLRETLGTLDISNPESELSPAGAMSQWLFHGTPPAGFTLDDECEIRENSESGGTIRCKNIDITQGAVRKHLENQSSVVRLAMSWNDHISFMLDQDLTLRRIRPLELINNHREEALDGEDPETLLIADMMLFQAEIRGLIQRLFELLETKR